MCHIVRRRYSPRKVERQSLMSRTRTTPLRVGKKGAETSAGHQARKPSARSRSWMFNTARRACAWISLSAAGWGARAAAIAGAAPRPAAPLEQWPPGGV